MRLRRPGQKTLDIFCETFPCWKPRVAEWEWKGFHLIRVRLTDGNVFLIHRKKQDIRVISEIHNGHLVYDSSVDKRKGL